MSGSRRLKGDQKPVGGVAREEAEAYGEAVVSLGRDQRDVASTFFNPSDGRAHGPVREHAPQGGRPRAGRASGDGEAEGSVQSEGGGFRGTPAAWAPLSCSPLTQSLTQGPP